jgi:hypothetical protein
MPIVYPGNHRLLDKATPSHSFPYHCTPENIEAYTHIHAAKRKTVTQQHPNKCLTEDRPNIFDIASSS